jgi:2-succinyl-5-enolpyruvyl-6-hydroxy-3-cyclohexene-1-carboxylate synthase
MASKLPALIAALCAEAGVRKVFSSPGARSAPLLRAFAEQGHFDLSVVNDERAAAFIALGWVKGAGQPAILLCTSGSALLNYAPALAEADGTDLPLLIVSADRPREFLGQFEGQTTHQDFIFSPWTRVSLALEEADWTERPSWCLRSLNSALDALWDVPSGPVHINVHLKEPLFEKPEFTPLTGLRILKQQPPTEGRFFQKALAEILSNHSAILAIAGAKLGPAPPAMPFLAKQLLQLGVPVLAEAHAFGIVENDILYNADHILQCLPEDQWQNLAPDILITWGGNIVGKKIKLFLQRFKPRRHIHVDPAGRRVDMFHCLTEVWKVNPADKDWNEIEEIISEIGRPTNDSFQKLWRRASEEAQKRHQHASENLPFGDFLAVDYLFSFLPSDGVLHVGNSMPLRYLLNASAKLPEGLRIDTNRGVSGIDGTLGTAVGLALAQPDVPVFCLLGDLSFHHGLNALWIRNLPTNLKIIILNNGGGNIFGIIPGPAAVPRGSLYFENRASSTAQWDARKFGLHYFSASSMETLRQNLPPFLNSIGAAILEIFTDPDVNISAYKQFEQYMSSRL